MFEQRFTGSVYPGTTTASPNRINCLSKDIFSGGLYWKLFEKSRANITGVYGMCHLRFTDFGKSKQYYLVFKGIKTWGIKEFLFFKSQRNILDFKISINKK